MNTRSDSYQLRRVAQLHGRDGRTVAQLLGITLEQPAPFIDRRSRPAAPGEFQRIQRRNGRRYPPG